MNLLTMLKDQPTSVRVMDHIEAHDVQPFRHRHKHFAWPNRLWQGAWFCNGYIIRCWLDEVLMDDVRRARGPLSYLP